jgi:hypothetical protein
MIELVVALIPTPVGPKTREIYGTVRRGVSKIKRLYPAV